MMARETGAFTEAWPVHSGFGEFRGNAQDDPSLRSAAIALNRNEYTYRVVSDSIFNFTSGGAGLAAFRRSREARSKP
jgi:hypothetical protein